MTRRVDPLPCVGLFPDDHKHRAGCLPIVARSLPPAPLGWRWEYGRHGWKWGVWLSPVGGGGRWWVVGLDLCPTAADLVRQIHAVGVGARLA